MADQDPLDDVHSAGMTAVTSAARVGEALLRAAEQQQRRAEEMRRLFSEEQRRRYEAEATVAESTFRRMSSLEVVDQATPEQLARTVEALDRWRQIEPGRFDRYMERIDQRVAERTGKSAQQWIEDARGTDQAKRTLAESVPGPSSATREVVDGAAVAALAEAEVIERATEREVEQVSNRVDTPTPWPESYAEEEWIPPTDAEMAVTYDSWQRREREEAALVEDGVSPAAARAHALADTLSASSPSEAAASPGRRMSSASARSFGQEAERDRGVGRGM